VDKRLQHRSKNSAKPGTRHPLPRIPFWLVRGVLGLVLLAAGTLKLYEVAFEAHDDSTSPLSLMVFSEAELLGGIWMVGGFDPERIRRWAVAAFIGLALSSLFQALAGKCSCGCFGSLSVNPWFTLVFDLAAVAALLGSRPPGEPQALFPDYPLHGFGLAAIALLIGVAGWRQADLVTVAGTVMTADGRPLEEATLTFTGASGNIVLRTDYHGNFHMPLVRPGVYAVAAPGRIIAPIPTFKEAAGRVPGKKTAQRFLTQFDLPSQTGGREPFL
jgi:hypothetical protein